jgi:Tfp pilus assembly protein PilO
MKISRREKILIVLAVYALMMFGGYKYIISPTQAELSKVKAANASIDQQLQKAVSDGKLNNSYQSAISKGLANYLELEEQLPRDKQLVELVDQLGTLADENKVTLLSVGYTDTNQQTATEKLAAQANQKPATQTVAGTSNMNLSLSTSGTYYHLLSYLQALEKAPRIIVVQSATISVGQKKAVSATATVGSTGTYTGSSGSNPPPAAPISKGSRLQTAVVTGTVTAPVQSTPTAPTVPEMTKYDLGNIQMNLSITSYYDQSGSELDKLLSLEQIKILTGGTTSNTAVDKNGKRVIVQ